MYIRALYKHTENVGAFVLIREAFSVIHPIRMANSATAGVGGLNGNDSVYMYTSSHFIPVVLQVPVL